MFWEMPLRALLAAVESFNEQFPDDEETKKFGDAPSREEWEAHKASMTPEQRAWHGFDQKASVLIDAPKHQQHQADHAGAA